MQLLRPFGRQMTAEKGTHLLGLGAEHFGEYLRVVSVARQTGFEPVQIRCQNVANRIRLHRFLADAKRFLERPRQIQLEL